jgi:GT2 family glycosyltransferase
MAQRHAGRRAQGRYVDHVARTASIRLPGASEVTGWPSVTAVVPTHDRPADLRRAVEGIFAQDYPGAITCVVVFDRAEPFDLSDVVPEQEGRTLMVTRNARTPGPAGARNTGVDATFGDLIAFCDDDDEWLPGKLSAQVEALHADPDAHVVLTGIEVWRDGVRTPRVPDSISVTNQDLCRSRMTELHTSSFLVDREAYEGEIGPFDELCPEGYGEDYEWLLRASAQASLVVVRDPLVRVYWGTGSYFAERWQVIIDGVQYLLAAHPELRSCRENLSRMEGRVAFAYAALGRTKDARRWALRSIARRPFERRPYLALAVSSHLVRPATIRRWANRTGRGV